MSGPSTAGEIARHTGLTSGAVTGLIDRLERLGPQGPGARARGQDRPIAQLYAPLEKAMQSLLAGYSREELKLLIDFAEQSGDLLQARTSELNDSK
jgi:DNA-binding MarR family transcriptional regulator